AAARPPAPCAPWSTRSRRAVASASWSRSSNKRSPVTATRVQIGVVSKAHGIRGEMVVVLHDPESTSLEEVDTVHVGGVARAVVQARPTGGAYLLAVEGITDRDAAGALRGAVVEVDRDALDLDEDDVLLADLVGCTCVLPDG